MRWRTVWMLVGTCGLLAAVITVFPRRPASDGATLLLCPPDSVADIEIGGQADTLHIDRDGGEWRLVHPVADLADRAAVNSILDQINDLSVGRSFSPEGSLEPYGLSPPSLTLTVREHDNACATLSFGAETPAGTHRYAVRDDQELIHLVPQRQYVRLLDAVGDIRSRRILQSEPESIDTIECTARDTKVRMIRTARGWELRAPVSARADDAAVRTLLSRLRERVVLGFPEVASTAPDPTTWVMAGSMRAETLRVHRPHPESLLVRSSARPAPCAVDTGLASLLGAPPLRWRTRAILPWQAYDVTSLTLVRSDDTLSLRRRDVGRWNLGRDEADGRMVMEFIRRLEACRVESFLDEPMTTLPSSAMEVAVGNATGDSVTLRIGQRDGHARIIAAAHLGSLALTNCIDPDSISLDARSWRSRRLVHAASYEIDAIEVLVGSRRASARRRGFDQWKTSGPWSTAAPPDTILAALESARITRFAEDIEASRSLVQEATLRLSTEERTMELTLWSEGADSVVARVDGGPPSGVSQYLLSAVRTVLIPAR